MDTHAARSEAGAAQALGITHTWAGIGQLFGPLLAGIAAQSDVTFAVGVGVSVSAAGLLPGLFIASNPRSPASDRSDEGRVWRQPGMSASFAAAGASGSWRGLMDSIIPVLLREAGQSFGAIGATMSVANAMSIPGAFVVVWLRSTRLIRLAFALSTIGTGLAILTVAFAAHSAAMSFVVVAVGGLGSGILQTVAPFLGSIAARPDQTAEAIAPQGMCRTLSMPALPAGASAAGAVVPVAGALFLIGFLVASTLVTTRCIDLDRGSA